MQKKVPDIVSNKIKVLSFSLILCIVLLHSYNLKVVVDGISTNSDPVNFIIQNFISDGLTRIAVPFFFLISGFLFYINSEEGNLKSFFLKKYKSRFFSLVIPYLIWSFFGIVLFFLLQLHPATLRYFNTLVIKDMSLYQLLNKLFFDPVFYQLWFIRDLIVYVLVSPIIFVLVYYGSYFSIIVMLILWLFRIPIAGQFIIHEGLMFFSLGALLAFKSAYLSVKMPHKLTLFLGLVWILIIVVRTYILYAGHQYAWVAPVFHLSKLLGMLFIWSVVDRVIVNETMFKWVVSLSSFSFFIFATHEPIMTILKKVFFILLPVDSYSQLIVYFFAPLVTVMICIFIGRGVKRLIPWFYNIATGGRAA